MIGYTAQTVKSLLKDNLIKIGDQIFVEDYSDVLEPGIYVDNTAKEGTVKEIREDGIWVEDEDMYLPGHAEISLIKRLTPSMSTRISHLGVELYAKVKKEVNYGGNPYYQIEYNIEPTYEVSRSLFKKGLQLMLTPFFELDREYIPKDTWDHYDKLQKFIKTDITRLVGSIREANKELDIYLANRR